MNPDQFFTKYNGKYIDYDKVWGFQCTDEMRQYIKEVDNFAPYTAVPVSGNAKDIFKNFVSNKYYSKILNSPTNAPQKGDLVFWGFYPLVTGWAGHVAVCSVANGMNMVTFDQNYGNPKFCKFVAHSYKGVMGWLHKK